MEPQSFGTGTSGFTQPSFAFGPRSPRAEDCGDPQFPKGPAWSAVKKCPGSEAKRRSALRGGRGVLKTGVQAKMGGFEPRRVCFQARTVRFQPKMGGFQPEMVGLNMFILGGGTKRPPRRIDTRRKQSNLRLSGPIRFRKFSRPRVFFFFSSGRLSRFCLWPLASMSSRSPVVLSRKLAVLAGVLQACSASFFGAELPTVIY